MFYRITEKSIDRATGNPYVRFQCWETKRDATNGRPAVFESDARWNVPWAGTRVVENTEGHRKRLKDGTFIDVDTLDPDAREPVWEREFSVRDIPTEIARVIQVVWDLYKQGTTPTVDNKVSRTSESDYFATRLASITDSGGTR